MKFLRLASLSGLMVLSAAIFSYSADGGVTVSEVWTRPVIIEGRPSAVYFTLRNDTNEADTLIKAQSSLAEHIELHVHKHEDGVMRMMQVAAIPLAAHGTVKVAPGGYHLMVFGLRKKLAAGDEFPLTLTFTHAGKVAVLAKVMRKAP